MEKLNRKCIRKEKRTKRKSWRIKERKERRGKGILPEYAESPRTDGGIYTLSDSESDEETCLSTRVSTLLEHQDC